jgi:Spy/CpxP family protein refolding chaperone
MTMIKWSTGCVALLAMLTIGSLQAQTTSSPTSPATSPRGTTGTRLARKQPCWQVAGISQSAMQKHREIEENTRGQIESVCSDSALSAQQKQQKIHELREQAKQQSEGVVTASQQEALKSCREQRGEGPRTGGMHGGGGPCGETSPATKP